MLKLSDSKKEIEIYVDEIYPEKDCNFIILGALYVECDKRDLLQKELVDKRCGNPKSKIWNSKRDYCENKEKCRDEWHKLNDVEVHYQKVKESAPAPNKKLCEDWITYFKDKKQGVYCNVLFLDMSKIDKSLFGNYKSYANIYNRFFRSLLTYGMKCFFQDNCSIKNIYFDKSTMLENHEYFPKRNLVKLKEILKDYEINCDEIKFIESDHKKSEDYMESHFIQYVDLIMGIVRQIIFYVSKDSYKNILAMKLKPVLDGMVKYSHSSSNLKISFFPKDDLKYGTNIFGNEVRYIGQFYSVDGMRYKIINPEQPRLDKWF